LKHKAKIIILKLDGTEGLSWEINSIKDYLYKVLFVASDMKSYGEFVSVIKEKELSEFANFPKPESFPAIIWTDNTNWYYGYSDCFAEYISEHPWQKESMDYIIKSLAIFTSFAGVSEKYLLKRLPTFIHGNKYITFNLSRRFRLMYSLFPFSQQYFSLAYLNNSIFSTLVNLYIYGSAMVYYLLLYLVAYNISESHGGFSFDNTGLKISVVSFIGLLPIYVLSFINGPKTFRLGNSFLSYRNCIKKIKKNFFKGMVLSLTVLMLGFYTKHKQDTSRENSKLHYENVDASYKDWEEEMYCKHHIDSIFSSVSSNWIFASMSNDDNVEIVSQQLVQVELKFHRAISDSINANQYYPTKRDSLKTDRWYEDVFREVANNQD